MESTDSAPPRFSPLQLMILVAAVAAPLVAYVQMLFGWGLMPAEFAADGDETLRVAGYTFSVWGLIYLG